jgi:hypothetical protein
VELERPELEDVGDAEGFVGRKPSAVKPAPQGVGIDSELSGDVWAGEVVFGEEFPADLDEINDGYARGGGSAHASQCTNKRVGGQRSS